MRAFGNLAGRRGAGRGTRGEDRAGRSSGGRRSSPPFAAAEPAPVVVGSHVDREAAQHVELTLQAVPEAVALVDWKAGRKQAA